MSKHPYAIIRRTPSPSPSDRSITPTNLMPPYASLFINPRPKLPDNSSEFSSDDDSYVREPMPNLENLGKSKLRPKPSKPGLKRPTTGDSEGGQSVAESLFTDEYGRKTTADLMSTSSHGSKKFTTKKVKFTPSISSSVDGSHEIYGSVSSESSNQHVRQQVAHSQGEVSLKRSDSTSFAQANSLRMAIMEQRDAFGPPTPLPPTLENESRGRLPKVSTENTAFPGDHDSPPPSPTKPITFTRKTSPRAGPSSSSLTHAPQTISLLLNEIQSASQPPTSKAFSELSINSSSTTNSENQKTPFIQNVSRQPTLRKGRLVESQTVEPGFAITSDTAVLAPKIAVASPSPTQPVFPAATMPWGSRNGSFNSLRAIEDPKSTHSDRSLNDQLNDMITSYKSNASAQDAARMQAFKSASSSKSDSEDIVKRTKSSKLKVDATGGIRGDPGDGAVSDGEGYSKKKKKKRGFFSRKRSESPPPVPVAPPVPLELPNIGLEISQGPRFSVNTLLKGVEVKWQAIEQEVDSVPRMPTQPYPMNYGTNMPRPAKRPNLPAISEVRTESEHPLSRMATADTLPTVKSFGVNNLPTFNSSFPLPKPQMLSQKLVSGTIPFDDDRLLQSDAFENPRPIPKPRPPSPKSLDALSSFPPAPSFISSRDGRFRDGRRDASLDRPSNELIPGQRELSTKSSIGKLRKPKPEKERMKREEKKELASRPVTPSALQLSEPDEPKARSKTPLLESSERGKKGEKKDDSAKTKDSSTGTIVGEKVLAARAMEAIQKRGVDLDSTDRKLRVNRTKKAGSKMMRVDNWRYAVDDSGPESGPASEPRYSGEFDIPSSSSTAPTSPPNTVGSSKMAQMPSFQGSIGMSQQDSEDAMASGSTVLVSPLKSNQKRKPVYQPRTIGREPSSPAEHSWASSRGSMDSRLQEKEIASRGNATDLTRSLSVDSVLDPMLDTSPKYGKNRKTKRQEAVPPLPTSAKQLIRTKSIEGRRSQDDDDPNPFYLADALDGEEEQPRFRFLPSNPKGGPPTNISETRSQKGVSIASYYVGKYTEEEPEMPPPVPKQRFPPQPKIVNVISAPIFNNNPEFSKTTNNTNRPKLKPGEATRLKQRLYTPP